MTRSEFEEIDNFGDLVCACNEYGCYVTENVFDCDGVSDYVENSLLSWARRYSWDDLRDILDDIPTDYYSWYALDEYNDRFSCIDDEFEDYKDEAREWFIDNDEFEDGDEEDCEEEDDEEPLVQEDFSLDELFVAGSVAASEAPKKVPDLADISLLFAV